MTDNIQSGRPPSERLGIRITHTGDCLIVHLSGEIDYYTEKFVGDDITAAVSAAAKPPQVIVDLGKVTFCDSAGLNTLVNMWKTIHSSQGTLLLANPTAVCQQLFGRTGLDQRLPIHPTVQDALAKIAKD
jgi:anti-sigma B factor antagonist